MPYYSHTKGKNPVTNPKTVESIYQTLEMLRIDREDLHAWWVGLLYCADGTPNYLAWNEMNLAIIENDVIYNID